MALINFSKADILRSKDLENEKWYSWEIAKCAQVPTADKTGVNFLITFKLIDTNTELDGKEIDEAINVSSKGRQWMSAMLPLVAAANGKKLSDIPTDGFSFDSDELVGKKIDGKHILDLYEGRLIGKVKSPNYLPYKSAGTQTSF
jgi:hypothetical protein